MRLRLNHGVYVDSKPLILSNKKSEQMYCVLLSNQVVIIDTEFEAMKKYRKLYFKNGTRVLEFLPTDKRLIAQTGILDNILENLERYESVKKG